VNMYRLRDSALESDKLRLQEELEKKNNELAEKDERVSTTIYTLGYVICLWSDNVDNCVDTRARDKGRKSTQGE